MGEQLTRATIAVAAVVALASPSLGQTLKVVAMQGEASPEPGFDYRRFSKKGPSISDDTGERVAFEGRATGAGKVDGIFTHDPDAGGTTAVDSDDPPPYPPGASYRRFEPRYLNPIIGSDGVVVFTTTLRGGFGEGVYAGSGGSVDAVALTGDSVPILSGSPTIDTLSFGTPAGIPTTNAILMIANLSDNTDAILVCSGGDLDCTTPGSGAYSAEVVTGDSIGGGMEICAITHLAASDYGIAFRARVASTCPTGAVEGVFRKAFGVATIHTLGLVGQSSGPGTPPLSLFTDFRTGVDISGDGSVAFQGRTSAGAGTTPHNFVCVPALPTDCPSTTAPVAAISSGDALPSGNELRTFKAIRPAVTDGGDLVFRGRSKGTGPTDGIYTWSYSADSISKIFERGDVAIGSGASGPGVFKNFRASLSTSDSGRIAFGARIKLDSKPPGTAGSRYVVYAYEP